MSLEVEFAAALSVLDGPDVSGCGQSWAHSMQSWHAWALNILAKKTASALACLSLVSYEPLVLKLLSVATHYGLLQHDILRLLAPIAGRTAKLGYNPVHPSLPFCL